MIDCTRDVFSRAGAHDLPAESVRVGGKLDREGDAGESMMAVPQSAQETWVCELPGIDECANSSRRVVVDIGSILR